MLNDQLPIAGKQMFNTFEPDWYLNPNKIEIKNSYYLLTTYPTKP